MEYLERQPLSPRTHAFVNSTHRFNTDTILLAWYSLPKKGERCADFGTGCGFIPLFWCDRANPASVAGVELQQDACELALRAAEENDFLKIQIIHHDLRKWRTLELPAGGLDVISCNPPYKAAGAGKISADSGAQLARHELSLCFDDIAAAAQHFLRWGGRFFCCHRPERLCDVVCALRAHGLEPKHLRFVQHRQEKAPFLFLLQATRGGKPGLSTEPALFVENEHGHWSAEMLQIYGEYKAGYELQK